MFAARYLQYDSWFYEKVFGAVLTWDAMPSVFPHGMQYVSSLISAESWLSVFSDLFHPQSESLSCNRCSNVRPFKTRMCLVHSDYRANLDSGLTGTPM